MIFKCKNCGGNVVYSPDKEKMFCPYCDGEDSHEPSSSRQGLEVCSNCGSEIHINDYTSASQCPYCKNYLIFDERVEGEYAPHLILPFKVSKEAVKKSIRDKFKSSIFAPSDFFSEAKLDGMQGMYVPFWMYDYKAHGSYDGECTKVRTWTSGDRRYTETSVYHVVREFEVAFDKMPVDASDALPDSTMDLMEPYDYKALEAFKTDYMSGFFAEKYNQGADAMEYRAREKAKKNTMDMIYQSIVGYSHRRPAKEYVSAERTDLNYALLPVWIYSYKYKNQTYQFHVNGQTGKIVGKVPIVPAKVMGYGATVFGLIFSMGMMLRFVLSVL